MKYLNHRDDYYEVIHTFFITTRNFWLRLKPHHGTILHWEFATNVLISWNLAVIMFSSFYLIYIEERERWMGFLQKSYLLIQI